MSRIKVEQLFHTYQDRGREVVAVDHIDFDVAENEFFTLLGPSGCGKTTTLRCLAGLERADERQHHARRRRGLLLARDRADAQARHRHGLPGLRRLAAHVGVRERRVPAAGGQEARCRRTAIKDARRRGPRAREHDRVRRPAGHPALRRAAAAALARPGPGPAAQGAAARRAALQPRRQAARADAQGAALHPAAHQAHHHLRHPRPGRGALDVQPGRGDAEGRDRAGRHAARDLPDAEERVRGVVHRRDHLLPRPGRLRRCGVRHRHAQHVGGRPRRA